MRGAWCVVLFVLAVSFGAAAPAWSQDDAVGIGLGSRPAAATVADLDGNRIDLGTVIGKKPVLIEFWATWCPRCAALVPKMEVARARYGDQVDFVAIAVAVGQTPAAIKRHLTRHAIPFRVFYDSDGSAVRAFQAPATSFVVILDRDGKVVYTGIGEEQDIDAAVRRVVGDGRGR